MTTSVGWETSSHGAEKVAALRKRFSEVNAIGVFVLPNAWDVGSARILAALGFPAIATTSSGHAAIPRTDRSACHPR